MCNLQFDFRKIVPFRHAFTLSPIFRLNLRSIGLLVFMQPNTKVISTSDRQTDWRIDVADDNNRYFFSKKKLLKTVKLDNTNLCILNIAYKVYLHKGIKVYNYT